VSAIRGMVSPRHRSDIATMRNRPFLPIFLSEFPFRPARAGVLGKQMGVGGFLEAHVEKELGGSRAIEGHHLSYLGTSQRWFSLELWN
jgi:hypothetical protein